MSVELARRGNYLVAADEDAANVIKRMGHGEIALFNPLKVRSILWHRMYFGICREIGKNQDPQRDEHSIDMELRFRAGHKEMVGMLGDKELWVPKRIAFDKLSADAWAELWPSLELAIREHFGEGYVTEWQR
ncbi:MAG: hypothetical protein ACRD3Q_18560 [Terriglobales bacterium]